MPERTDSERIAVTEAIVLELKHNLLGNGNPGQVHLLHERVNTISKRVGSLENWKWWITGISLGVGTILGYVLR